jgi:hypothetical protein
MIGICDHWFIGPPKLPSLNRIWIRIQLPLFTRIRIQLTIITRIHDDTDPHDGGLYLEGGLDGVLGQHGAVELHRGQGQLLHKHADQKLFGNKYFST